MRRSGGFGFFHELSESGSVPHREIGENFAIESDARGLEAVNQLAIRQAILPRGRADALNPQAPILALPDAAVALGVTVGAIGRFLRGMLELAFGEEKAFGPFEILFAPCPALGAAFYACHRFLLFSLLLRSQNCSAREPRGLKTAATDEIGKQDGLRDREKRAVRNGFVSGGSA